MGRTVKVKKAMGKKEALKLASGLVQEAVDIAREAGIDPSFVIAPHCAETALKDDHSDADDLKPLKWCGVQVIIDNNTDGLFEMPELSDDLEQKPAFLVTHTTAALVRPDFERYRPSLERMAKDWQEEKKQFMREQGSRKREDKHNANRVDISGGNKE